MLEPITKFDSAIHFVYHITVHLVKGEQDPIFSCTLNKGGCIKPAALDGALVFGPLKTTISHLVVCVSSGVIEIIEKFSAMLFPEKVRLALWPWLGLVLSPSK